MDELLDVYIWIYKELVFKMKCLASFFFLFLRIGESFVEN
jgi:hypothetical protein